MSTAQDVAAILLKVAAVKLSINPPFTWNTGLITPIYCDNRIPLSFPEERRRIIEGYKQLIADNKLEFDVVAGTATAGIPWASFIAHDLNKPLVYVRSHPKDYGLAKLVEGTMPKGSRVLVVEDLISTGRSSLATIAACQKEYGATVVAVVAVFSYEMEKSRTTYAEAGIPLYTQSGLSTLVDVATETGYIKPEQKEIINSWSKDPENWWNSVSAAK